MVNHSNLIDEHRKVQKKSSPQNRWSPPEEGYVKITVDAVTSHRSRSTSIALIMRDSKANVLMTTSKQLGDCHILLTECEAVRQAIIMTVNMNIHRVRIHSDSQVAVSAINGKIGVPKDIINVVEGIRQLLLVIHIVEDVRQLLLAESKAVRQAIIMAVNINIHRVCTHSDSQVAVNTTMEK